MRGRILIADDDTSLTQVLKAALEVVGYEVMCVADGARALILAHEYSPDVILLDVAMPILDGMAALAALKKDPRTEGIPVVVITGRAINSVVARGHALGAAFVLEKPFTPDDVLAILGRLLPVADAA